MIRLTSNKKIKSEAHWAKSHIFKKITKILDKNRLYAKIIFRIMKNQDYV